MTEEYFSPDHVFLLSGHGAAPDRKNWSGKVIEQKKRRYALKDNEFYASATNCGMLGTLPEKEITKFITYKTPIEIPSLTMASFYTNRFPISTARQLKQANRKQYENINTTQNIMFNIIAPLREKPHKIYAPFLKNSPSSSTVPNNWIQLLSIHKLKEPKLTYPKGLFTFEGANINLEKNTYKVYRLMISGILQSGQDTVKSIAAKEALKKKSDQIVSIFNISRPDPNSLYIVFKYVDYEKRFSDEHEDPLTNYLKEAIIAMCSDSFIKPYELLSDATFNDAINSMWSISDLFDFIRSVIADDQPILLINELCRPTNSEGIADNTAYSNNESDPKSYHYSHPVRRRKNETRRLMNIERHRIEQEARQVKIQRLSELFNQNYQVQLNKQKVRTQRANPALYDFLMQRPRFRLPLNMNLKKGLLNRTKKRIFNEYGPGPMTRDNMIRELRTLKQVMTGITANNIDNYISSLPPIINSANYNSNNE